MNYDAIVLAGGGSTRLGGRDKSSLRVEGLTLLQRTLDAVEGADRRVVVGGQDPRLDGVRWLVEEPAGGGPAAAIGAGVRLLASDGSAPVLVVLACDMPQIAAAVPVLLEALGDADDLDSVVATAGERTQYLAGAHLASGLHEAVLAAGDLHGASVRSLWSGLRLGTVDVPAGSTDDIDTWEQATRAGVES